jgi:hypothetical protein
MCSSGPEAGPEPGVGAKFPLVAVRQHQLAEDRPKAMHAASLSPLVGTAAWHSETNLKSSSTFSMGAWRNLWILYRDSF